MKTKAIFDILFDKRRQEYLSEMRELFNTYMLRPKQLKTNKLLSFSSWPAFSRHSDDFFSLEEHQALFEAKNSDLQEGGFFLSVNQKGICINPSVGPGGNFFEQLCQKGYSLQDIDVVIATSSNPSIKETIIRLHSLNRECNRTLLSYGQEPHIIRFFLHPELYASVSSQFRPIFREELNCVLSLETFAKPQQSNSHEVRAIDDTISLAYTKTAESNLAIRLDFSNPIDTTSFGFIVSGGYHESLSEFFEPCTLLIGGIGQCTAEDLEKVMHQTSALGFYGLLELTQNAPNLKLVLITEFSRSMGDCRLELIEKLNQELEGQFQRPKVLPLDKNFSLLIDSLVIETQEKKYSSFEDVRVVRPNGSFGTLMYIDSNDVL